jgi:hypothetical protein
MEHCKKTRNKGLNFKKMLGITSDFALKNITKDEVEKQ